MRLDHCEIPRPQARTRLPLPSVSKPGDSAKAPPLYEDGAAYTYANHPLSASHMSGEEAETPVPSASLPADFTVPSLPTLSDRYPPSSNDSV